MRYLDHLPIVRSSRVDADVDYLEHAGVVVAGIVLFKTVVVSSFLVILHGEGILAILLVDLGDPFLQLGHVGHPVGGDIQGDRCL